MSTSVQTISETSLQDCHQTTDQDCDQTSPQKVHQVAPLTVSSDEQHVTHITYEDLELGFNAMLSRIHHSLLPKRGVVFYHYPYHTRFVSAKGAKALAEKWSLSFQELRPDFRMKGLWVRFFVDTVKKYIKATVEVFKPELSMTFVEYEELKDEGTLTSEETHELQQAPPLPQHHVPPLPQHHAPPLPQYHAPSLPQHHALPMAYFHAPPMAHFHAPPMAQFHTLPMVHFHAPPLPQYPVLPMSHFHAPSMPH